MCVTKQMNAMLTELYISGESTPIFLQSNTLMPCCGIFVGGGGKVTNVEFALWVVYARQYFL